MKLAAKSQRSLRAGTHGISQVPIEMRFWPVLKPDGDRERTIWLVAGALVAGFGLGWAGGFGWYGSANRTVLNPTAQIETPSHRIAEIKPSGRTEGARKTTFTSGLQTLPGARAISAAGSSPSANPQTASPGGANPSTDSSSTVSQAIHANITLTERGPIAPAPETRPTTIEGWTVLDVRGGTAVLEGPDGTWDGNARRHCTRNRAN